MLLGASARDSDARRVEKVLSQPSSLKEGAAAAGRSKDPVHMEVGKGDNRVTDKYTSGLKEAVLVVNETSLVRWLYSCAVLATVHVAVVVVFPFYYFVAKVILSASAAEP